MLFPQEQDVFTVLGSLSACSQVVSLTHEMDTPCSQVWKLERRAWPLWTPALGGPAGMCPSPTVTTGQRSEAGLELTSRVCMCVAA